MLFRSAAGGLELIEVAPGIDVESQVIGVMGFRPLVGQLRPMRAACFVAPNKQERIA